MVDPVVVMAYRRIARRKVEAVLSLLENESCSPAFRIDQAIEKLEDIKKYLE